MASLTRTPQLPNSRFPTRIPDKHEAGRGRRHCEKHTSSTSPTSRSASLRRGARTLASTVVCPGLTGTVDYIYNRDVNAPVYLNEPPGCAGAYTGIDNRPRWAATAAGATPAPGITTALPSCVATGQVFLQPPHQQSGWRRRLTTSSSRTRARTARGTSRPLTKSLSAGFSAKGGFNYGVSRSVVEPRRRPTARGVGELIVSGRTTRRWPTRQTPQASVCFAQVNYTKQY